MSRLATASLLAPLALVLAVAGWASAARAQAALILDGRYSTVIGLADGRGCTGFCVVPYDGTARDARTATISDGGTRLALGSAVYTIHYDGSQVRGTASLADRTSVLTLRQVDDENLGGRAEVQVRGGECVAVWSVALRRTWSTPAERAQWMELRARERCERSGVECRAAAEAAIARGATGDGERFARRACEAREPDATACALLATISSSLRTAALARACALGALDACPRDLPVGLDSGDGIEAWLRRAGALVLPRGRYLVNEVVNIETGGQSVTIALVTIRRDRSGGHAVMPGGRPAEAARAWSSALRGLTRTLGAADRECSGEACSFERRAVWLFRGAVLDLAGGTSEFQLRLYPATTFREVPARDVPALDGPPPVASSRGPTHWHWYCAEDDEGAVTVCASAARVCAEAYGEGGAAACVDIGRGRHPGPILGYAASMWRPDDEDQRILVSEGACLLDAPEPCDGHPEECARD